MVPPSQELTLEIRPESTPRPWVSMAVGVWAWLGLTGLVAFARLVGQLAPRGATPTLGLQPGHILLVLSWGALGALLIRSLASTNRREVLRTDGEHLWIERHGIWGGNVRAYPLASISDVRVEEPHGPASRLLDGLLPRGRLQFVIGGRTERVGRTLKPEQAVEALQVVAPWIEAEDGAPGSASWTHPVPSERVPFADESAGVRCGRCGAALPDSEAPDVGALDFDPLMPVDTNDGPADSSHTAAGHGALRWCDGCAGLVEAVAADPRPSRLARALARIERSARGVELILVTRDTRGARARSFTLGIAAFAGILCALSVVLLETWPEAPPDLAEVIQLAMRTSFTLLVLGPIVALGWFVPERISLNRSTLRVSGFRGLVRRSLEIDYRRIQQIAALPGPGPRPGPRRKVAEPERGEARHDRSWGVRLRSGPRLIWVATELIEKEALELARAIDLEARRMAWRSEVVPGWVPRFEIECPNCHEDLHGERLALVLSGDRLICGGCGAHSTLADALAVRRDRSELGPSPSDRVRLASTDAGEVALEIAGPTWPSRLGACSGRLAIAGALGAIAWRVHAIDFRHASWAAGGLAALAAVTSFRALAALARGAESIVVSHSALTRARGPRLLALARSVPIERVMAVAWRSSKPRDSNTEPRRARVGIRLRRRAPIPGIRSTTVTVGEHLSVGEKRWVARALERMIDGPSAVARPSPQGPGSPSTRNDLSLST